MDETKANNENNNKKTEILKQLVQELIMKSEQKFLSVLLDIFFITDFSFIVFL